MAGVVDMRRTGMVAQTRAAPTSPERGLGPRNLGEKLRRIAGRWGALAPPPRPSVAQR
jgi:hypothetical protein